MPSWIRDASVTLKTLCDPPPAPPQGNGQDAAVEPVE